MENKMMFVALSEKEMRTVNGGSYWWEGLAYEIGHFIGRIGGLFFKR